MKVILLRDVARVGRKSEIKEVPSGHAINFLIPRKLAIPATPESVRRIAETTKKRDETKEHAEDMFRQTIERLANEKVVLAATANDTGSLFKGVHADDIIARAHELGIHLTKDELVLAHPIKDTGVHVIPVVHGSIEGVLQLEIIKK
jgi:large subunit ribosomal protein L9